MVFFTGHLHPIPAVDWFCVGGDLAGGGLCSPAEGRDLAVQAHQQDTARQCQEGQGEGDCFEQLFHIYIYIYLSLTIIKTDRI